MRILGLVFLLLCSSIYSYAQSAPKGVETTDIDKSVQPCVDSYQYANGLGLPDRDYYVKQEPRFKEARE